MDAVISALIGGVVLFFLLFLFKEWELWIERRRLKARAEVGDINQALTPLEQYKQLQTLIRLIKDGSE